MYLCINNKKPIHSHMERPSQNTVHSLPRQAVLQNKTLVIAGATGALGQRIAAHLRQANVNVIALVRKNSNPSQLALLEKQGVTLCEVDFDNESQLVEACTGADCIVSALNGLEEVIIATQKKLLQAALKAGVPRFIPSDYCIDYTKLPYGSNRNLDLRKQFNEHLDTTPIAATSILNGMFTDLLTGEAPVVLFGLKRIVYWGNADQPLDFTTLENTAEYTARAALDEKTPRYLRIAGDETSAKELKEAASEATGNTFRLLRAGGLSSLQTMIKITRKIFPKKEEVFPPWQGMQYLHNMFTGMPKLVPLDNHRYSNMQWTSVQEVLAKKDRN
jgi:nucleoside-diphosphate-sugar epimerase